MKKLLGLAIALVALGSLTGPAVAQQQSWSVAIEQNPMLTNCGTTTNIPVAGAGTPGSCATAIPAAQSLLTTLLATPNCMVPHCPAGSTMIQGAPSCTPDPYTVGNSSRIRYQVSLKWNCVPPLVSCANPPPATNYNTGSTSANNVPLNQCYKNTAGECLYNFAAPGTAGGWNTGCPPAIAGSNCCGWTPSPATSCQDDLTSGKLTITGPNVSSISATSANLIGTVSVNPIPSGCTYQAKLVWGPPNWTPATGPSATGSIPTSPLSLSGTASPLNPSSGYGARIEVTKQCGGLAPTTCNGPTKRFETPKETGKCDLAIKKTVSPNPVASGKQVTITLTVTNVGMAPCPPGPFPGTGVRDNQPAGLTFTAPPTSLPGWQCSLEVPSSNATCATQSPLPLPYMGTFTFPATVTAPPGSHIQNCGTVTNANDTNPTNNQSCVTINVIKKFPSPTELMPPKGLTPPPPPRPFDPKGLEGR